MRPARYLVWHDILKQLVADFQLTLSPFQEPDQDEDRNGVDLCSFVFTTKVSRPVGLICLLGLVALAGNKPYQLILTPHVAQAHIMMLPAFLKWAEELLIDGPVLVRFHRSESRWSWEWKSHKKRIGYCGQ